jgi:lipid-binding SYLF domain-containing protein
MGRSWWIVLPFVLCMIGSGRVAFAQVSAVPTPEAQTVAASMDVLQQFTTFQIRSIPQELLRDAQGVVIIPSVVKLGFIVAGRFGRGVALVRTPEGSWRVPTFVTFAGGSIGWQAGLQATDLVLVFKNRRGIEQLLSGNKFTLGADAAIAAGPVGRQAATGTDLQLNAEIYSYSRSRGLFAGVSLDGSVLQVDNYANAAYYANGAVPQQAIQLAGMVANDSAAATAGYTVTPAAAPAAAAVSQQEAVRRALVDSAQKLSASVDVNWGAYLALPKKVYTGEGPLTAEEASSALAKYNRVATDPAYRSVAAMPHFQSTYALLRSYAGADAAARTASNPLPQPQ